MKKGADLTIPRLWFPPKNLLKLLIIFQIQDLGFPNRPHAALLVA